MWWAFNKGAVINEVLVFRIVDLEVPLLKYLKLEERNKCVQQWCLQVSHPKYQQFIYTIILDWVNESGAKNKNYTRENYIEYKEELSKSKPWPAKGWVSMWGRELRTPQDIQRGAMWFWADCIKWYHFRWEAGVYDIGNTSNSITLWIHPSGFWKICSYVALSPVMTPVFQRI